MSRAFGWAALAAALTLGACATNVSSGRGLPPPTIPGQVGQVRTDGGSQNGVMVTVYAPTAQRCSFNNRVAWRVRDGRFDFLYERNGAFDSNGAHSVVIDCATADGRALRRTFEMPLDMDSWRMDRATTTVVTTLLVGPLGLLAGPAASEMNREQYRFPPILIHMPAPQDIATAEARDVSRQAAVRRWGELHLAVRHECDGGGGSRPRMAYACRESFFNVMRDLDLQVFSSASGARAAEREAAGH